MKHPLICPVGMVGGAPGSFMGDVHRRAMAMTGRFALKAGCLSRNPDQARQAGAALGLSPRRIYTDPGRMAVAESARPDGIRLAVVVTPNNTHLAISSVFLDAGIMVFCEKPLSASLDEATDFAVKHSPASTPMVLAYTYSGYAMVREARRLVAEGVLGTIRFMQTDYLQDWLCAEKASGSWRLDAATGGAGGCLGDIGTHAFHLTEFVSGLRCEALAARVSSLVPGHTVPDDASVEMRFSQNALGGIRVSQVATGCGNALRLRLFGDKAGLEWNQERADELILSHTDGRTTTLSRGGSATRAPVFVPRGHPEGYLEAFARLYQDLAGRLDGEAAHLLPTLTEGLRGQRFVEAALDSGREQGAWRTFYE